jgi:hypothetical protein
MQPPNAALGFAHVGFRGLLMVSRATEELAEA